VLIPGRPKGEPSLGPQEYMKLLKESKLLTRQGDLRHDFPETAARKVFNDVQIEEETPGSAGSCATRPVFERAHAHARSQMWEGAPTR
jgi:hypothetical protein